MANKHSTAIRAYLNSNFGKVLTKDGDNNKVEISYTAEYFMRGIPQKDGSIVYSIYEQSMADSDIKYDYGRPSHYIIPKTLTEDEAKKIIGGSKITLDENNIVN